MARTYRRGKPSRNIKHYIKHGVVHHENREIRSMYCGSYNGLQYWKEDWNDTRTYEEYFAEKVRIYHSELSYERGIPRYVRDFDVSDQTRKHKAAIKKAMHTGDFDVVLCPMLKRASWFWWD